MALEARLAAGKKFLDERNYESAAECYEQSLILSTSCTEAAAGLGISLQRLGRNSQSLPYLAGAANQNWQDPHLYFCLGNCYFAMGQFAPASSAFGRAATLDPTDYQSLVFYAHALVKIGKVNEAEHSLREALALNPEYAFAHDLMAFILPQQGKFEEAKGHAARAAILEPANSAFASRFVFAGKLKPEESEVIDRLTSLLRDKSLKVNDRIRIEYALGKGLEDLRQYRDSLAHYIQANRLSFEEQKKAGNAFDPMEHRKEIDMLIQRYGASSLQTASAASMNSSLPIFIVGMMRSGTTLTEQILSSHPLIHGAGELDFWIRAAPTLINASPEYVVKVATKYVAYLQELAPGKERVCDKMPQNYMSIGPLASALPNAKFIHCRRDPRDTCFSIFTIPFTFHPPSAYSMKNIASTYREYLRLMDHWRTVLPTDRLIEVDYEDLVADKEGVARRLIDFVGLEWSDSCLFPEKNERIVATPSRWQVRQPIYSSSIGRCQRFAPYLDEMLDDWKYARNL